MPWWKPSHVSTPTCQGGWEMETHREPWRRKWVSEPLASGRQPQWKSREGLSHIPRFFLCQTTPTQVASAKVTRPSHSGPPSLALTGAVGCMITAMGSWRRKAATSGHNHTNTDLPGDGSPVVRLGLPIWATDRTWVFAGSEFSECSVCDVSALPQRSDTAAESCPSCPQLCRPR